MAQSIDEMRKLLRPWELVKLTCKGPDEFRGQTGYAAESFADAFEFKVVVNAYEHFSNISAPPETRTHLIRFADVITLEKA